MAGVVRLAAAVIVGACLTLATAGPSSWATAGASRVGPHASDLVYTNRSVGPDRSVRLPTRSGAEAVVPKVTKDPSSVTVASGAKASFTAGASGDPAPTVQWRISTNSGATFTSIAGATATTYTFTTKAVENGDEYKAVFTNSAGTARTTAATLTVTSVPVVTSNPSSVTVASGAKASFTAGASGEPSPTVQWKVSTNSGATFTSIAGATATTYTFTAAASKSGDEYEAVFTNSRGTARTTAATLTVTTPPVVTTNPSSLTITSGGTASFTAAASGSPSPTVQWEDSTDGGGTFTPIGGATGTTYSFTTMAGENGDEYEAVFTNSVGTATATAATLTVTTPPVVTSNPLSQTVAAGGTASFTAAASGSPSPTVQWEVSTDGGGTFTPIGGATGTTYSFTTMTGENGDEYEAVFTNSVGTATTTAATLTVTTPTTAPVVTSNPSSLTVTSGGMATFTAAASGFPAPTVQWEVSTDSGTTFTPIGGATGTTYSFTTASNENGDEYEAVFTNSVGTATTTAATLTVTTPPVVTSNPSSVTVTSGGTATFIAAATGSPAPTVQWEVSTDYGTTFTPIGGATATTYSFTTASMRTVTSTRLSSPTRSLPPPPRPRPSR